GHVEDAARARKRIGDENLAIALDDLKRERHVGGARHPRHVALRLRVLLPPVLEVLLLLLRRPRLVGDLVALDNADAGRFGKERPELGRARPRAVREDVPVGLGHRLPETVEVGMTGEAPAHAGLGRRNRRPRRGGLTGGLNCGQREEDRDEWKLSHGLVSADSNRRRAAPEPIEPSEPTEPTDPTEPTEPT